MRVALKQQDEIKSIIQETISSEEQSVLQCAANFHFTGLFIIPAIGRYCSHCSLVHILFRLTP